MTKTPAEELLAEIQEIHLAVYGATADVEDLEFAIRVYRRALADGKAKAFGVGSAVLNEFVMCEKLDALDAIAEAAENAEAAESEAS